MIDDTTYNQQHQAAAPPRRKPMVTLIALAVALFLSTATFGTLWLVERDDHHITSNDLRSTKDTLGQTDKDLEHFQKLYSTAYSDKLVLEGILMRNRC